jgi:hypothetical protein
MPAAPSVTNHTIITRPNRRPTAAVPRDWNMNSAISTTTAIGTT